MLTCDDCNTTLTPERRFAIGENDRGQLRPFCLECADARFEEADPRCHD